MKFQMTKEHTIDLRHDLPVSMLDHKPSILNRNSPSVSLRTSFHRLFKIFSNKEQHSLINEGKSSTNDISIAKENESHSLQQLEDCANAARESEGYDQYE